MHRPYLHMSALATQNTVLTTNQVHNLSQATILGLEVKLDRLAVFDRSEPPHREWILPVVQKDENRIAKYERLLRLKIAHFQRERRPS